MVIGVNVTMRVTSILIMCRSCRLFHYKRYQSVSMAICCTKCMRYLLHRFNNLVITLLILTSDSQLNMSTTQQVNYLIERESSMAIMPQNGLPHSQSAI